MKKNSVVGNAFLNCPIPGTRKALLERLRKTIWAERLIEANPSQAGLNPYTEFEKHPPLFFGIGGGNHELSKALPFDTLSMILVSQKLKQTFELGPCYLLLADETTASINTFPKKAVKEMIIGQKKLLEIILSRLEIAKDWTILLESDLEKTFREETKTRYEKIVSDADQIGLGKYYSRETATTIILVGEKPGGIKLGWSGKGAKNDERAFDAKTEQYMEKRNFPNWITFVYTPSGVRILPGRTGQLERVPPYICVQPWNRILLSPFEKPLTKIEKATEESGGLRWKWSRKLFSGITQLFEELVLSKRIALSGKSEFRGQKTAEKIAFILRYIFEDSEREAKKIWKRTFPTAL